MKELKRGISVVTFLLAIVALVFTCNIKVHAGSAKTTEATEAPSDTAPDDSVELPEENPDTTPDPDTTPAPTPDNDPEAPGASEEEEEVSEEQDVHKYDDAFEEVSMTKSVKKAVGLGVRLTLSNIRLDSDKYTIKWTSSNEKVATVSKKGYVSTKSEGKAVIKAKVLCDNDCVYTYKCTVTVTNPKFQESNYGLQVGGKVTLKVKGTTTQNYKIKIKNKNIVKTVSGSNNRIRAYKLGQTEVTAKVDGKTITCKIYVTNPKLAAIDYFVVKGSSEKLRIKSWSGKTKPSYKSSNSKVATVTQNGYIVGHKNGSCVVTVNVEGKTLKCYVAISNKTVVKTLKSAYTGLGCRYSQPRRMSKNYYDCSSFTWRNYSKHGVYFGSKHYAPTAAEEARNMVKHHKAVAYKYVSTSKLQPGDVLFIRSSSRNGRYRNIGHVVIYMGNGRIIHATPPRVCISNYSRYAGRVAVVSRPTK